MPGGVWLSRSAVLWGRECVWSLFLSAARESVRAVESHDDRRISSIENEEIRVVSAAERRRNTAWGFQPPGNVPSGEYSALFRAQDSRGSSGYEAHEMA